VWPLRALRRRMRTGPDPAPSAASESLRRQIKAAEIGAEQIELAALARSYGAPSPAADAPPLAANAVIDQLAAFLAARYGNCGACAAPEIRAALDVLAAAWRL